MELDILSLSLLLYTLDMIVEEENKSRKLTDKDLPFLLRQLRKHAAKWRDIGIHLEFLPGELDTIEARPNLAQVGVCKLCWNTLNWVAKKLKN